MLATTADESSPPERKAATGTSLIRWAATDESPRCDHIVEGLDAEAIPREAQRPMLRVPDGEGEHATQSLHRGRACLLVQVHDGFGVGGRPEPVPAPRQVRAQLAIVVDLAV